MGNVLSNWKNQLAAKKKSRQPFTDFGKGFTDKNEDIVKQGVSTANEMREAATQLATGLKDGDFGNLVEGAQEMAQSHAAIEGEIVPKMAFRKFMTRVTKRKNDAVRLDAAGQIMKENLNGETVTRSRAAEILQERKKKGSTVPTSLTLVFEHDDGPGIAL